MQMDLGLCFDEENVEQNHILEFFQDAPVEGIANIMAENTEKRPGEARDTGPLKEGAAADINKKKIVHREVERQRRLEMSRLYSSLRSLLPADCTKGKQSVTDLMHYAVDYIKHMQEHLKGLIAKRDKLKKLMAADAADEKNGGMISPAAEEVPNTVSLRSSHDGGVEILINSCFIEEGFPLSRVLQLLSQDGLIFVSCTFTKVNSRLRHSIQFEASDVTRVVDLSLLQEKLTAIINTRPCLSFD